jgi:radical SAM superfamily enzyme YgiQ (UPF0313 family)
MPLIFAVGCPKPCGFCSIAQTADGNPLSRGGIYYREPEHVIADMRWYMQQGVGTFSFVDDNFTANRKKAKEFCRQLIQSGLKVQYDFTSGVRIDLLDEELVQLMVQSGCRGWGFGVESGSIRVREKLMHKAYGEEWTNAHFTEQLENIRAWSGGRFLGKDGMTVPFIMMGYPKVSDEPPESPEEMDQSIDMIAEWTRKGLISAAHFSIFIPLPGTEVWHGLPQREQALYRAHWEYFNVEDASHLAAVIGGGQDLRRSQLIFGAAKRAFRRQRPGLLSHLPISPPKPPQSSGATLLELKQMEGVFSMIFSQEQVRDSVAAVTRYLAPSGLADLGGIATRMKYVFHKLMAPG